MHATRTPALGCMLRFFCRSMLPTHAVHYHLLYSRRTEFAFSACVTSLFPAHNYYVNSFFPVSIPGLLYLFQPNLDTSQPRSYCIYMTEFEHKQGSAHAIVLRSVLTRGVGTNLDQLGCVLPTRTVRCLERNAPPNLGYTQGAASS
jgi:hypothetical protein